MYRRYYSLLLLIVLSIIFAVKGCDPAEEGSRYVMSVMVPPQDVRTYFVWMRDYSVIADCLTLRHCKSSFSHSHSISKNVLSTGHYNISLTIVNVTRADPVNDASRWTFVSVSQPVTTYFSCDLKVFAPVRNATCSFTITSSGVNISCFVMIVYPDANCHLDMVVNKKHQFTFLNFNTFSSNMSATEPVYYSTTCSTLISLSNLTSGLHELYTYIYPNLTNTNTDKKYGQILIHGFNLEIPTIEIKVKSIRDVNGFKSLTCLCYRTDSSQTETNIQWYRNNFTLQHNNGTIVVVFEELNTYDEYYCQATNVFGWKSEKVRFKPSERDQCQTGGDLNLVAVLFTLTFIFIVTTLYLATHLWRVNRCTQLFGNCKRNKIRRQDSHQYIEVDETQRSGGDRNSYITIIGEPIEHYQNDGGATDKPVAHYQNDSGVIREPLVHYQNDSGAMGEPVVHYQQDRGALAQC